MNSRSKAEVKISPHDPQRGVGDNGGPKLQKLTAKNKVERIKEVLDMEISAAQKCIGIRIIADADTDGITPELSTEDLKRSASVKDRETVYRATRKLDEKKVAKTVKEEGRPNRYLVLPSEAIDAVLDEIDATGRVEPDPSTPVEPDGYGDRGPVGLNPTTPIRSNPTGRVEPDGSSTQDARVHTRGRVDITSHGNKEFPSGIVTSEELASKLASSMREQTNQVSEDLTGSLAGLNDLAEQMVADAHRWLGSPSSVANAREWLANTMRTYGEDATTESYHKLKTEMLNGKLIANPIATWMRIAQRMKSERGVKAPACEDCWVDQNGLHLVNGFRAEWLKKFDGSEERLEMAIKAVAPDVKLNSQMPIKVQVDGMLAKLIGEKLDKDARYARAATAAKPEKV